MHRDEILHLFGLELLFLLLGELAYQVQVALVKQLLKGCKKQVLGILGISVFI